MKVLGLDTSTFTGGAGLVDEGQLVAEYVLGIEANHSERLLPAVEHVLSGAGWSGEQLDAVAVTSGPGSFTGLRIGVATAKVLAYAWDKPLIGVSTLEAMAWQQNGLGGLVVPIINARRNRVYAAVYRVSAGGDLRPQIIRPAANLPMTELLSALNAWDEQITFVGDAVNLFSMEISSTVGGRWLRIPAANAALRAGSVAALGEQMLLAGEQADPFTLIPSYLRKAEAEVKWERAHRS